MLRYLYLLLVYVLLSGCALTESKPQELTALYFERGLVKSTSDGFFLRSCERDDWRKIDSASPELEVQYQRITKDTLPFAVYFEGWFNDTTQLQTLQMLGGDIATCKKRLKGSLIRAGGLEPIWYADINDENLVVHHSTALRSWRIGDAELEVVHNGWRWRSKNLADKGPSLKITRRPCVDLLGVWYALSAQFRVEGFALNGCARYGDLDLISWSEKYYSRDPSLLKQIGLTLELNGDARLSLIDSNGGSEPYNAVWQTLGDQSILVNIDAGAASISRAIVFRRTDTGLVLKTPDLTLGESVRLEAGSLKLIDRLRLNQLIP